MRISRRRLPPQCHDTLLDENVAGSPGAFDPVNPLWKEAGVDPEGAFIKTIVDEGVLRHLQGLSEDDRMAVVLSDLEHHFSV